MGYYEIDGSDHEYDDRTDCCIWCGESVEESGGLDCPERRERVRKKKKGVSQMTLGDFRQTALAGQQVTPTGVIGKGKGKGLETFGRCYESHPGLLIAEGLPLVYGGSCGHPIVEDADVYVGFDKNMKQTYRSFPWKKGAEFLYHILDMAAPKDEVSFVKMLTWVHEQMKKGAKVHAGCIGGHGRTGLFFAALRHHITGDVDAIEYVRKNYCEKAVESAEQMTFLAKLGLKKAKPTKSFAPAKQIGSGSYAGPSYSMNGGGMLRLSDDEKSVCPIPCNGNVWGAALDEV